MTHKWTGLIWEGGGAKGMAFSGAIKALEQANILPGIKRVGGSSAGAITAYLLALGYTTKDIQAVLASAPFTAFKDANKLRVITNFLRVWRRYGIYPGEVIEEWLRECARRKQVSPECTFEDLHELDAPSLYVVVMNVHWGRYEIMSHETHPEVPVIKAVRASMAIPLAFTPVEIRGDLYVDGGTLMNYPVRIFDKRKYLPDGEQAPWSTNSEDVYNHETLGFRIDDPVEIAMRATTDGICGPGRRDIKNIMQFAGAISSQLWQAANAVPLHAKDWQRTVVINSMNIPTMKFELTASEQYELERQGYDATRRFLMRLDVMPAGDHS